MPISELEKKWWGMNFNIAAEEMRRLKETPKEEEQLALYSLYKQALHGDIPPEELYKRPNADVWAQRNYDAWLAIKGQAMLHIFLLFTFWGVTPTTPMTWDYFSVSHVQYVEQLDRQYLGKSQERAKEEYVRAVEEMIKKYGRTIVRSQWNSQVWTVDY